MTYPRPRSLSGDLREGMSDGKYKKIIANRGGVVEKELAYLHRDDLADTYFGIHEEQLKQLPDGTADARSIDYVKSRPAGQLGS